MLRAAFLLPVILACAAPAPTAAGGGPGISLQDRGERRRELEDQVYEATRRGDYERLRALVGQLEELEIEPLLSAARKSLQDGDPEGALETVERALEQAPEGPTARMLHGDACLELGRRQNDAEHLEEALTSYLMAGGSPPRWLEREERREFRARANMGASRALTTLGRHEEALEKARQCLAEVEDMGTGTGVRNRLDEWPEKRFFDAAFDVYVRVRGSEPERAADLVAEMEQALERPLKHNRRAVWPFSSLSALYLGEGRYGEAREAALEGLEAHPDDLMLPGQLTEAAREIGGSEAVHAAMAVLKERAPLTALPWWYSARERFEVAVAGLGETPIGEFEAAEAEFRRCRELQPEYGPECLVHEALCRAAEGWTHLAAGRLQPARAAFRSMEDVYEGGLEAELRGVLESGVVGLDRIGRAFFERDQLEEAAAVYQDLHEYQPQVLVWAVRSGQYHRDAGARMLVQAEAARRRSSNPDRDPERSAELLRSAGVPRPAPGAEAEWRAALARVDVVLSKRAGKSFETSYAAYRDAAALAPADLRVLADAAALPIQHLDHDLDWARTTLERCVALGREQLAAPGLEEERRLALQEAWGDAHQSLGVLAFDHDGDREAARRWFEQSLSIGPYPRPIVEEDYLPRCAKAGPDETP